MNPLLHNLHFDVVHIIAIESKLEQKSVPEMWGIAVMYLPMLFSWKDYTWKSLEIWAGRAKNLMNFVVGSWKLGMLR